jgi:PAS domain S-box-containing protein
MLHVGRNIDATLQEIRSRAKVINDRVRHFSAQVKLASERASKMMMAAPPPFVTTPTTAVIEELHVANEELAVAAEELREQNDELARTRAVAESERERYVDLFHNAPEAYLVTDLYGVVHEANLAAALLLNMPAKYLAAKPLINFVARQDTRKFRAGVEELRVRPQRRAFELRIRPRHKPVVLASLSATPVRANAQEPPVALRWIVRELAEVERAATARIDDLESALLHVQAIVAAKNALIAAMADALARPGGAASCAAMLVAVRAEANAREVRREPIHLDGLVTRVVDAARAAAAAKHVALTTERPDTPCVTDGHAPSFECALGALLAYAVERTPAGRALTIRLEGCEGQARLFIVAHGAEARLDEGRGCAEIAGALLAPHGAHVLLERSGWLVTFARTPERSGGSSMNAMSPSEPSAKEAPEGSRGA